MSWSSQTVSEAVATSSGATPSGHLACLHPSFQAGKIKIVALFGANFVYFLLFMFVLRSLFFSHCVSPVKYRFSYRKHILKLIIGVASFFFLDENVLFHILLIVVSYLLVLIIDWLMLMIVLKLETDINLTNAEFPNWLNYLCLHKFTLNVNIDYHINFRLSKLMIGHPVWMSRRQKTCQMKKCLIWYIFFSLQRTLSPALKMAWV